MKGSSFWLGLPDREDEEGDRVTYGAWVPSDVETYWKAASDDSNGVWAACTRPGERIVTAWCGPDGVPLVGAVDEWRDGVRLPSDFYVFDPAASGSTETGREG